MKAFAQFIHQELELPGNPEEVVDICEATDRYCMYKVGPVLSMSVSMTELCHKLPYLASASKYCITGLIMSLFLKSFPS